MAAKRSMVDMPRELLVKIDKLVGPRKRSAFLTEIAEKEIKRRRLLEILSREEPFWKDEDHEDMPDVVEWVKNIRKESDGRIPD